MRTIVGLTGQSGAGKTTVSHIFAERGFTVINCDQVAREVTEDGSECCKALAEVFPECFDKELRLDRRRMAGIVFSDKAKLKILTDIQFPFITRRVMELIESSLSDYVLLDAPTLFDAGLDSLCSSVIAVVAKRGIRSKRIMLRDGLDQESAEKRLSSQKSEAFFRERCQYIIENSGPVTDAEEKALAIVKEIIDSSNGSKEQKKKEEE